jgi:type I restriction enzyme, S subunit
MSKVKLGDVAELITKGTTPTSIGGAFAELGINFVKSESIAHSKHLNADIFEKIDEETDKKLKRSRLKKDDLLFSIAGAYLGKVAIVRDSDVPANTNQAVGIVRLKHDIVDKDYAYYFYSLKQITAYINNLSSQSSQPNLNLDLLGRLPFELKALKDQQKIAAVLSALDAKIDCNNRINTELETMANTLYDYWFVQFDFPDANGKPYKSSGGKVVYNATLKREIPVGWDDSSVLAVADLLGGGTPTKKKPEYWSGDIPFFTPTDADGTIFKFSTADYITDEGLRGSSTKLFGKHTVFITARGSVGRLVLAGVDMAMNQSCYALRAKPGISHVFLFFLAKELIHHLQVKSSGSIFDSIVSNDIELTKLAIPKGDVIEKFAAVVEPAFEKIANNTKENYQLAQLRDWLLPLLMNGQVTISR